MQRECSYLIAKHRQSLITISRLSDANLSTSNYLIEIGYALFWDVTKSLHLSIYIEINDNTCMCEHAFTGGYYACSKL